MSNASFGQRGFDVVVIGGGAVGLATAMALLQGYRPSLAVLEAENHLAAHQTGHNSGVIHSGLYYRPGTLRARLCVEGRDRLYRFCQDHGIPHERCGKVVVATDESELPALDELERRGRANGLAGLRRLSIEEVRQHEPHAAGIAGLFVAETGIVDFARVAQRYGQIVGELGGTVLTGHRVLGVRRTGGWWVISSTGGEVRCRGLVNCAGLQCDRVAVMCGLRPAMRIVPFRGEYYSLAPSAWRLVRGLIYPVPDQRFPFLGVHLTRLIGGGVEAGPNAVLALAREGYTWSDVRARDVLQTLGYAGLWRMAGRYWRAGAGEVWRSLNRRAFLAALQRLVPELSDDDLAPGGAGVRAQALDLQGRLLDDFHIQCAAGAVHVLNAPSPAATASLSIGQHIAALSARMLGLGGALS